MACVESAFGAEKMTLPGLESLAHAMVGRKSKLRSAKNSSRLFKEYPVVPIFSLPSVDPFTTQASVLFFAPLQEHVEWMFTEDKRNLHIYFLFLLS